MLTNRKVIQASAGTGKTYRLSLEFISILLQFPYSVSFDEILVITFTKKATAEIRQRIFEHIKHLIAKDKEGTILWNNLSKIDSNNIPSTKNISHLSAIYKKMLTNKNKLQISTIDAFTNSIFSSIVAPFFSLSEFTIDPKINEDYLPDLYQAIFAKENLSQLKSIFSEKVSRNLSRYKDFIQDVIQHRWIFDLLPDKFEKKSHEDKKNKCFLEYRNHIEEISILFFRYFTIYLNRKNISEVNASLFKQEFWNLYTSYYPDKPLTQKSWIDFFTNQAVIANEFSFLMKNINCWNGRKLFRSKSDKDLLETIYKEIEIAVEKLADYLYYEKVILEQQIIFELAKIVLQTYDPIKLKEKIFTYDDITYYTYRFLHDPELSIVDEHQVLNVFYERLSRRIRFILIDEFQDTSLLQWKIIFPLIQEVISGFGQNENGGVTIVGDEKQSIYSWRGGKRDLLLQAPKFLQMQSDPEKLSISYRSTPIITNFINSVFGNQDLHAKLLSQTLKWNYHPISSSSTSSNGLVQVVAHNRKQDDFDFTMEEQIERFCQTFLIPKLQNNQINQKETAILARTNKQLKIFADVLREKGYQVMLESSFSLFEHRAVNPLFFLFNFIANQDLWELLKWFRSDVMRLSSNKLKQLMIEIKNRETDLRTFLQNQTDPIWEKISTIYEVTLNGSIINLIKTSLEQFSITTIFPNQTDLQNIHQLIVVATQFLHNQNEYGKNLVGFLQYCKALRDHEEYNQIRSSETNVIKLISFHKAKGLQFDNVIVFLELGRKAPPVFNRLRFYEKFDSTFHQIEDLIYTFNHNNIIERCSKKSLVQDKIDQKNLEEINNLYVALTRAKQHLWLWISYKNKKDYVSYLRDVCSKRFSINHELMLACTSLEKSEIALKDSFEYIYSSGNFFIQSEKKGNESTVSSIEEKFWKIETATIDASLESPVNKTDMMKRFESVKIGSIVHFYLSFIIEDTPWYQKLAKRKTNQEFGAKITNLDDIANKIQDFVKENYIYYTKSKWDQIHTEYTIFDSNHKEFRLDRLLISNSRKEILILDYKTGESYSQKQIDQYCRIIQQLEFVKKNNYNVSGKFLEIKL